MMSATNEAGAAYPFHIGKPSHCDNRKAVEVMTSTLGSVASLLTS
jgi:hypothetical protein